MLLKILLKAVYCVPCENLNFILVHHVSQIRSHLVNRSCRINVTPTSQDIRPLCAAVSIFKLSILYYQPGAPIRSQIESENLSLKMRFRFSWQSSDWPDQTTVLSCLARSGMYSYNHQRMSSAIVT